MQQTYTRVHTQLVTLTDFCRHKVTQ